MPTDEELIMVSWIAKYEKRLNMSIKNTKN